MPTPAPTPAVSAPLAPPEATPPAPIPREDPSLSTEPFQAVDASVVPVPIESLNRLVLAVDELGSEMTHVRQAIRDLTAALSDSQANVARALSAAQTGTGTANVPDPLDAVTGPYVSGAPTPTPFSVERPPVPPAPELANALSDLPIVSTGAAQVVIGPIASLDELDDAVEHIRRITGVESVAVTSFEGPNVVLTADLSRALPLASLLRNALGREVASCRNVDGRIVVDFGEAGPRA